MAGLTVVFGAHPGQEIDRLARIALAIEREEMVEHNYGAGRAYFSYSVLRRKLRTLITNYTGLDDL